MTDSMTLGRFDQLAVFDIWQPRWHDKTVLLACHKVDNAKTIHLKIKFTKAKSMAGDWYVNKKVVQKCKKETNGTIMTYVVPLDKLQPLEINERDIRSVI